MRREVTLQLEQVSVVTELERAGLEWEPLGGDELRVRCPFHDDTNPSCQLNVSKKVFKCYASGCGATGDFITFMARVAGCDRKTIIADLSDRYDLIQEKPIDSATVERYHKAIWAVEPLLKELRHRAVTDEDIRKYRLGFDKGRITIPIPSESGAFVNVRRYLPGAPGPEKMRNSRGHGQIRLYPLAQLEYDNILVVGGEIKAIVTARHMNPLGFGAICATAGEGNWEPRLSRRLKGKKVWVILDVDEAGQVAAQRLCGSIRREAAECRNVVLDLPLEQYPHGDPNDYFGPEKKTAKDLVALLNTAEIYKPPQRLEPEDESEHRRMHLVEAIKPDNVGTRVAVPAVIRAMHETPFLIPGQVRCHCDRNQPGCLQGCPVYETEPDVEGATLVQLRVDSPGVLDLVSTPKSGQREVLREALRIPECKSVEFQTQTFLSVEETRVSPRLEISERHADREMLPCFVVGSGLELNSSYILKGRVHPHPRSQQATLVVGAFEAAEDALSSYAPSEAELAELEIFQPEEWSEAALAASLEALYADLEANVSRIYRRRNLHLAIDLAYHSPLLFHFDGRLTKGWVEVLVTGDSSQGKSECSSSMMHHYQLGAKVDCKNASAAGLVGGLAQLGNRWFVVLGSLPTQDKRLVILEELKGVSPDELGKLTDMRSSGVAEISKIEKRRAHARTRLVALSNPRSGQPLSAYNFGVEAIAELMRPEDVRRFDLTLLLSSKQVDQAELNQLQRHRPQVPHRYVSELCRRCVLWAWSRNETQIQFQGEAAELVLNEAARLCAKYDEAIPLVDRGSFRLKLARLSASLAARTFSCSKKDMQTLVVRPCHVAHIAQFIDTNYSDPSFGYLEYTRAYQQFESMADPVAVRREIFSTPFPKDFVEQMLSSPEVELRDICDWCGWDRGDAIELLSFLVRKRALRRPPGERAYKKSAHFISLLREMRDSKDMSIMGRPGYVKERGRAEL